MGSYSYDPVITLKQFAPFIEDIDAVFMQITGIKSEGMLRDNPASKS